MNYLIAKRKRTKNTYYLVLAEETGIYKIPGDLNAKPYDSNYSLEDDEWFGIENFGDSKYTLLLLSQPFNSAEHSQIPNTQFDNIKFFCAIQQESYYCFQKFSYSNVIKRRWFNLSGEPKLKSDQPIIIIKEVPDAIYWKEADTLYFKNLANIKSIFPDIFELYKEATDEETEIFLSSEFIKLSDGYSKENVKSANRKRIAMAMETLNSLQKEDREQIHIYIREYCPDLNFSDAENTFEVSSEDNLKKLIFGIEQRFYTTPVGGERRVANSISKL